MSYDMIATVYTFGVASDEPVAATMPYNGVYQPYGTRADSLPLPGGWIAGRVRSVIAPDAKVIGPLLGLRCRTIGDIALGQFGHGGPVLQAYFPDGWNFFGQLVNGADIWSTLSDDRNEQTLRLVGLQGLGPEKDFIVSGQGKFIYARQSWNIPGESGIFARWQCPDQQWTTNYNGETADANNRDTLLSDLNWDLQHQIGEWVSLLPMTPAETRRDIWVSIDDQTASFDAFTVSPGPLLEVAAIKTLRLRTAYDAELESLNPFIIFGKDHNGIDNLWSITSVDRVNPRELILNLQIGSPDAV